MAIRRSSATAIHGVTEVGVHVAPRLNLIPSGRTAKNVSTVLHNNKEDGNHDPSLVKEIHPLSNGATPTDSAKFRPLWFPAHAAVHPIVVCETATTAATCLTLASAREEVASS